MDRFFLIRAPSELIDMVGKHARSQKTTASAFARAALIAALKRDGVQPPLPRTREAS